VLWIIAINKLLWHNPSVHKSLCHKMKRRGNCTQIIDSQMSNVRNFLKVNCSD